MAKRGKAEKVIDGVIATPKSGNSKTGQVAATYVSQDSCPKSCPLMGSGCYAETGPISWSTTNRVNGHNLNPTKLAITEALKIASLPGDRKLRVHVVGDAKTPMAAFIVGRAMVEYHKRSGFKAWTYTHAWRDVPVASWQGAEVLASCENSDQVKQANKLGYSAAMVIERHNTNKVHNVDGLKVVPCPQQTTDGATDCAKCGVCMGSSKAKGLTVAFAIHGAAKKKALKAITN